MNKYIVEKFLGGMGPWVPFTFRNKGCPYNNRREV